MLRKALFGIVGLVVVLVVVMAMSSGGTVAGDKTFTVDVAVSGVATGNPEFSGSIMTVTSDGKSNSRSVEGKASDSYTEKGSIVSVSFQKKAEDGTLKVVIKDADGKIVNEGETSASYGVVAIATK